MEYTIENETLVYFALRTLDGDYLHIYKGDSTYSGLQCCTIFKTMEEALRAKEQFPEFSQIRKIKIIDIGEL